MIAIHLETLVICGIAAWISGACIGYAIRQMLETRDAVPSQESEESPRSTEIQRQFTDSLDKFWRRPKE